ncbi:single-strand annealing protein [Caudoviricetes sp.]|nr:single-strand annealing protein [Caudoviricetes sp.]
MTEEAKPLNIYQRVNQVRQKIDYIQKDKSVSTGGGSYKAVTHDMVTAMVRQHMIDAGIVCFPYLVASASMPKEDGSKQFRYEATYDFTFANADIPDEKIVIRIQTHAMDNADKAPLKALSMGKKGAVLKLFEIETGEDEEGRKHEVSGMDEQRLTDFLTAIGDAANTEELLKQYTTAYKAAQEAQDKDAMAVIIKAKDNQKAKLTKAAA